MLCFVYSYLGLRFTTLFLPPLCGILCLRKPLFACDHARVCISLRALPGSLHPGSLYVTFFYLLSSSPLLSSGFSSSGFHFYVSVSLLFLLWLMLCPSVYLSLDFSTVLVSFFLCPLSPSLRKLPIIKKLKTKKIFPEFISFLFFFNNREYRVYNILFFFAYTTFCCFSFLLIQ